MMAAATDIRDQRPTAGDPCDDLSSHDPSPQSSARRCLATGVISPKYGMIRFVIGPDGSVVPDLAETLPGRGLWVTADAQAIGRVIAKGLFAKAARTAVTVPADLLPRLESLLRRRCAELLSLARRGGRVVAGFEKVAAALRSGTTALRLEAADGAADGRNKLDRLAPDVPVVDLFDRALLAQALGRLDAVHVAIAKGPLAHSILREANRLATLTATTN